jgi:F-type H+-transporting ATPase subunit delta
MAETATIARPYAEALFKAVHADYVADVAAQVDALASVAADERMRQFADNPKVDAKTVYDVMTSIGKRPLSNAAKNLLRTVIDNGRLAALPGIASQFRALANARSGVSDATVYSAFPLDSAQLAEVVASLEKRFGRKLNATVEVEPGLIGGVRVVVGDEVLDASVRSRLEQMKIALTA